MRLEIERIGGGSIKRLGVRRRREFEQSVIKRPSLFGRRSAKKRSQDRSGLVLALNLAAMTTGF
jgi:hypothetical protein